ncbi:cupin domain-containing protein [Microbacterium hominis]|uniref:Cupin domain-containing protein n=1 Tax=Microbacterium hominis TaxID=162426 RepID=A0A7D4TFW9_9MICO|nr:cupin domain-containing protein [Microbacterium hominis]QKJ19740.1 cupin domain-containing protein [Microbacterium hominis]
MTTTGFTVSASIDRELAEPFEVGTVQWVRRLGDGHRDELSSGFWFITPEEAPDPMLVVGHADETVFIVEGHVRIELEGQVPIELRPGGAASLNKGVPATWTVLAPTVEFFVYS